MIPVAVLGGWIGICWTTESCSQTGPNRSCERAPWSMFSGLPLVEGVRSGSEKRYYVMRTIQDSAQPHKENSRNGSTLPLLKKANGVE